MKRKYIIYNILSILSYFLFYLVYSKFIYYILDLFNTKEKLGVIAYELTHLFIGVLSLLILLKILFGYYSKTISFNSSLPNCDKFSTTTINIFKIPIFITSTLHIRQFVADHSLKVDNYEKKIIITHFKLLKLINWKKIKNLTEDDIKILLYKLGEEEIIKNITIDNNLISKLRKEKIKNIL